MTEFPTSPSFEEELTEILAGKRKPAANSFTDLQLLAELSADRIIAAFAAQDLIENSESPQKDDLSVYIYKIISRSGCDIPAIVTVLSLIDRYQIMLLEVGESVLYTVDEARRLFLIGSMAIDKPRRSEKQEHLSFWMRVSEAEYESWELWLDELHFIKLLQIDPDPETLESEHEEGNESFWSLKETPKLNSERLRKTEEVPCMNAGDERQFTLSLESSVSRLKESTRQKRDCILA